MSWYILFKEKRNSRRGGRTGQLPVFSLSGSDRNDDNEEDVYFAFVYSDGYVTSQGIFDIVHDENEKRYSCSDDYDRIYEEAIEQNETQYRIEQIQ